MRKMRRNESARVLRWEEVLLKRKFVDDDGKFSATTSNEDLQTSLYPPSSMSSSSSSICLFNFFHRCIDICTHTILTISVPSSLSPYFIYIYLVYFFFLLIYFNLYYTTNDLLILSLLSFIFLRALCVVPCYIHFLLFIFIYIGVFWLVSSVQLIVFCFHVF